MISLGMAEPEAGSAVTDLRTSAVEDGDDCIINGTKIFGTHSAEAEPFGLPFLRSAPTGRKRRRRRQVRSRVVMTDCHGMGRGKTVRRHEMEALHLSGRPMPSSLFGQDIAGDNVEAMGLVLTDGGGDKRCWLVPRTLGFQPHANRGQVLVSMNEPDGLPSDAEPRHVLMRQVERARAAYYVRWLPSSWSSTWSIGSAMRNDATSRRATL